MRYDQELLRSDSKKATMIESECYSIEVYDVEAVTTWTFCRELDGREDIEWE